MTAIELRALQRKLGRFSLGPIDLALPAAGVVGLVGANGAGKSTLMRLLATVDKPDAGEIVVGGTSVSGRAARSRYRRRLGFVPQDAGMPQRACAADFLHHMAWLKEVPAHERVGQVDAALAAVDLSERRRDRIGTLSGGMQRRLGLAQALLGEPGLLLLDEPTVGLDPQQRIAFRDLVRRAGTKMPVVFATHLTEDVRVIASAIIVLDEGQILYDGEVAGLEGLGGEHDPGDSDLERGLSALLATKRVG